MHVADDRQAFGDNTMTRTHERGPKVRLEKLCYNSYNVFSGRTYLGWVRYDGDVWDAHPKSFYRSSRRAAAEALMRRAR